MILAYQSFRKTVDDSGCAIPFSIAVERENQQIATFDLAVFSPESEHFVDNLVIIERLVKAMLWLRGGWKIILSGCAPLGEQIAERYNETGERSFDWYFMKRVYGKSLLVENRADYADRPLEKQTATPAGRNLNGHRIGIDLGGSDYKFSAVSNGEAVFSEEITWHPKLQTDPAYHAECIRHALQTAASHLPQVEAIGISAAGIYVDNEVKVASLFIKIPENVFDEKVKHLFYELIHEFGENIPFEIRNDGDVAALAGAMSLNTNRVLGIAMGTSQAAGYVNADGNITGWLNELAFAPFDLNPDAMQDEWSGDRGCGVKYFSQDSVIKLCPAAGIPLNEIDSPAEKLKVVQSLMAKDDQRARKIYQTIGIYLGYALPYYAMFYDIDEVLLLGRVTSGLGGQIILDQANEVLLNEFPETARQINVRLPDEKSRRVGQSIAAASLPEIG
ncbi:MAG: ROK family protein [Anaerolineaceae bacterium]|nr:ROK family protein [Anaerolineaceae bacterium]